MFYSTMAHHLTVDAQGTTILTTTAPSMLAPLPGCISSVERAIRLAGDDPVALLDASGKLHTSEQTALLRLDSDAETSRWGVLWAQVACPSMAELWPLGSTSQDWGEVESSVTWMLAEGAGEGEGHVEILLPPSQRA